jgi:hypothetical protein
MGCSVSGRLYKVSSHFQYGEKEVYKLNGGITPNTTVFMSNLMKMRKAVQIY